MSYLMPSDAELDVAIMWLRANEGDGDESEACTTVALWLEYQQQERLIRTAARLAGITPAAMRRKLEEAR